MTRLEHAKYALTLTALAIVAGLWLWLSQWWWTWALHPFMHLVCWCCWGVLVTMMGERLYRWTGGK